jgi:hypothetical protein
MGLERAFNLVRKKLPETVENLPALVRNKTLTLS